MQSPLRILAQAFLTTTAAWAGEDFIATTATPGGEGETAPEQTGLSRLGWELRPPRIDLDGEVLWGDGIILTLFGFTSRWEAGGAEFGLGYRHNGYDLDYEPNIFGRDRPLETATHSILADTKLPVRRLNGVSLLASGSYYDGFPDFHSLWISEYYRQLFGEVPQYVAPDPEGVYLRAGLEWEYLPRTGSLELAFGYGRDEIAPAYDVTDQGVERARSRLYTSQLSAVQEHAFGTHVLWQNRLSWTDTTNRDNRWAGQTALNVLLHERWVLRLAAGGAVEKPAFDAVYGGATLEYEFRPGWYLSATGRFYRDTGEIENSLGGFDSSAPALDTFQFGLGLRRQKGLSAFKLYLGYYESDYDDLSEDNAFLANLYSDRRWGIMQVSWSRQF